MSISNATEDAILRLVFNATAWSNYADNAASSPQTNISVALHSASPDDDGVQSDHEISYTNYARVNVPRTGGGWTVSGTTPTTVYPTSAINFATGGSGATALAAYFSTGKTGGGGSAILWYGSVTPNVPCGNGVTPSLSPSTTIWLD